MGVLALVLMACSRESEVASTPIRVSTKVSAECLTRLRDNVSDFIDGRLNDEEVRSFWNCTARAIYEFQTMTAGDRYEPEAILHFVERYFLKPKVPIGPELLHSLMEMKRVLLGGTTQEITRQEVSRLYDFLLLAREMSVDINPHVRILLLRDDEASDEKINAAASALAHVGDRLGNWFGSQAQSLEFSQLDQLLVRIQEWMDRNGESSDIFENIKKGVTVLASTKRILVHGQKHKIDGSEWVLLTRALASAYHPFLSFRYAFSDNLNAAMIRQSIPQGLMVVSQLLRQALSRWPERKIQLSEITPLFAATERAGWLPSNCTEQALTTAFEWMLRKPLSVGREEESRALTEAHLDELDHRMMGWLELWDLARRAGTNPEVPSDWGSRFLQMLAQSAPMEWDPEGRLFYPLRAAVQWGADQQLRMVWPFVVIVWLKDAYMGVDGDSATAEQMVSAAADFLPVLQSFDFLKTTLPKVGAKLTREADLFTPSSRGDGVVQTHEAVRYLAFVASAFRMAEIWLRDSKVACPTAEANCVREFGGDLSNGMLTAMPRLEADLANRPLGAFDHYAKTAEETVLGRLAEGPYLVSELMQTAVIFHYVETFLRRYDTNQNDLVNLNESLVAYDVFSTTLSRLLIDKGVQPDEVLPFFTFLVKYGETPLTMMGGQILWLNWKWRPEAWAYDSDRFKLINILNQLAKLANS